MTTPTRTPALAAMITPRTATTTPTALTRRTRSGQMFNCGRRWRWFPDEDLTATPPHALPTRLTHTPTRHRLTTGIPYAYLDVIEINNLTHGITTIADTYHRQDEQPPPGTDDLYHLGFAGQPLLALHATTGHLHQVHTTFATRPLATSLDTFWHTIATIDHHIRRHHRKHRTPTPEQLADTIRRQGAREVQRADPTLWPTTQPAWTDLLNDIAATAE